ncbi:hypothetical protein [Parapedobacter tibetensis]|uniref:hypothetical protein n=1 Tax=Parapedobacter tibetensis TaxID=2972951 RepID=UPI00214D472B|nr:hypothetical protein [Parapedobacter tibetensis]
MIRYILFVLLVFASCASRKTRNTERKHQQQVSYQQVNRLDSLHTLQFAAQAQLAITNYREAVTIIPVGPFSYHPDSGYSGHATRVEVQREGIRTKHLSTRGSTQQIRQTSSWETDSLAIRQSHEEQHTDTRRNPWHWVMAALALASLGGVVLHWLCR